jgi:hypothetical protein
MGYTLWKMAQSKYLIYPLKKVNFHTYVSLPEGIWKKSINHGDKSWLVV